MTRIIDGTLRLDICRRAALGAAAGAGLGLTMAASAAESQSEATAEAAALAMDKAIASADAAMLAKLIAPGFLWVRGAGVRAGKAEFVEGLTAPGVAIEPFAPTEQRWFKSGELAILTARNELRGTENGEPFIDRHSFCDVWQRGSTGWQLVYAQITPAPDEE